tara:strand:+ start:1638 stop:1937 length:300 start_codon:yes stop_codon:yes gene_type:complete
MQTYVIYWEFGNSENHNAAAKAFVDLLESGGQKDIFDGFQLVIRVINPQGFNGWAIVKSSDHKAIWKWTNPWVKDFGANFVVTPVLTDEEYLEASNSED